MELVWKALAFAIVALVVIAILRAMGVLPIL